MGVWTYYSPLWMGPAVVLLLNKLFRAAFPPMELAGEWAFLGAVGVVVALLGQLLMVGAQGAFAQVVPVPLGKSVRGRGAVVVGGLVVLAVALLGFAGLRLLLRGEAGFDDALRWAAVGGAVLVAALVVYGWLWPMAVADFRRGERWRG